MYVYNESCVFHTIKWNSFEQNSERHSYNMWQRVDHQSKFYKTDIFEQNVNNMGIKLHNNLSCHLKIFKTTQFFRRKLKSFFVASNFLSVQEYLSYNLLSWKMLTLHNMRF